MTTSQDRERGKRTCSRCGDLRYFAARFPDGHICQTCLSRALKTRGSCPGCGQERALIGRRAGTAICRDCAGITREFSCLRCGFEGDSFGRVCKRCKLTGELAGLLDDGTGRICPALQPLADALTAAANPASALAWVSKPHIRTLLADLAAGRTELTHQALAARPDWRAAVYLRGLLISCGILPAADKHLLDYEAWLHRKLAALASHPHQRLLREFGLWHQLSRMRATAASRPLRPTARKYATDRFTAAETFLTWLTARGRRLADLTQAHIDAFYLTHRAHQRHAAGTFLSWAMDRGHLPRHDLPATQYGTGEAITQQQRLALLRRFAAGDHGGLQPRAAACLMLLYAQPLSRIIQLTASDITRDDDGRLYLRLGTPPAPVPAPFAGLLLQLTATSGAAPGTGSHRGDWLFPGLNPGQPITYQAMLVQLRDLGLPMRTARTSALRQLVLQAPAPVIVADALGFHHTTTQRQRANAGGTWNRYPATRSDPPGTVPSPQP